MNRRRLAQTRPWMLFAFPAAIVVPILAGLFLGGPAVGFLVAALVAGVIVVVAIRMEPRRRGMGGSGPVERAEDRTWRRAAARRFVVPLVIAAAGIVLVAAASSDVTRAIGWGVLAIAITVALSLVFLEIGYSEDRARAREARARKPRS